MSYYEDIYEIVRRIPPGRVSTYGRVAAMTAAPRGARGVGYALHALAGGRDVPWWRVINAAGRISNPYNPEMQRQLLEREGVRFDEDGLVDLARFVWDGSDLS